MSMTQGQIDYELRHWRNTSKAENDQRQRWILGQWGLSKVDGAVLEIGPGPYGGCLPFIEANLKVGLDPLFAHYVDAGFPPPECCPVIAYIEEGREKLPGGYDAVLCFNVLEHGTSGFDSIDSIVPLLAPGGLFYFQQSFRGEHQLNEGHDHVMLKQDFFAAIERNGLAIVMEKFLDADPAGGFDYPQVVGIYRR